MKKNDKNMKICKIAAILLLVFLVTASAAQAVVKLHVPAKETTSNEENVDKPVVSIINDEYYWWEDEFNNQQLIDKAESENFDTENGQVMMTETYPLWTDPSWTCMKVVTLSSSAAFSGYIIKIIADYDNDMRSDYGDLRFKFQNDDYLLDYWIEEKNPDPNHKYAIVWIKIPSIPQGESYIYMFYGNPSATDQSNYWALFDENSWEKEYVHDHQVTYHGENEGAWDPDIAYGNDKYLVTWEEGAFGPPYGLAFKQQIRGRYYDENGQSISNRFDIVDEPDETPPYRYENPSNVYGQGIFFVAYEKYTNPISIYHEDRDIEGAIVDSPQDGASYRFTICDGYDIQADPCVAFDSHNNRFFVVWEDAEEGRNNYNIKGKMFTKNGQAIGGEIDICGEPNSQCEPWIAYDSINQHYMVVWEVGDDPETGPFSIYMQLFNDEGQKLMPNPKLVAEGTSTKDYNWPCVASCPITEKFLITWQEDDISSGDWRGDVWGMITDANGNVLVNTFKIADGEFIRTDIHCYLSSSYFVAFDGGGDTWGKLVSSEGEVIPYTIQLSDSESEPADWVNIASSGEKIFIAWEDTRIVYPLRDEVPDVYANTWSFKIPTASEITSSISEEKNLVLNSHITSVEIEPANWEVWHEFDAVKSGSVSFDILDSSLSVIRSDVSPGANIESISNYPVRLKASFSRTNPSSSPSLDKWGVSYVGRDDDPPRTTIDNIDGIKGLNEWYISEGVIIWLRAEDFPEDTGSGIDVTYYTLNSGSDQVYNFDTGIQLGVSQGSNWMGSWDINFWSVDRKNNLEDKTKPENKLTIEIDADRPYVEITEPANEEQKEIPFWVRADPRDNVKVDRVEFDIEPFGEREGLPYVDTSPPYEWYCDVEKKARVRSLSGEIHPTDINVMVRAQVYDQSGQTWIHEIWVCITNWDSKSRDNEKVYINSIPLFKIFKLGIAIDRTLNIEIPTIENADTVKFVATKIFSRKEYVVWDNDLSDGCSASFDIPLGFYKITTYAYKEKEEIASDLVARVFFIAR